VLTNEEMQQGVVIVDIGGGTTDVAVFIDGAVVHTAVLPIGGVHMTRDLVVALKVPQPSAEQSKRKHGHVIPSMVADDEEVEVEAFGSEGVKQVPRRDRKSTRLNSSHVKTSYAVFCLKKKK